MVANITSNVIVPEVLTENNYEEWSYCIRNYLIAQDLWEVIENSNKDEQDEAVWRKKNAAVLHVFQISCSSKIFSRIKGIDSASYAWRKLSETSHDIQFLGERLSREVSRSEAIDWFRGTIPGELTLVERTQYQELFKEMMESGSCAAMLSFMHENPSARCARFFSSGTTLLHVLIDKECHDYYIEQIIDIMSEEELEIQDNEGNTALMCSVIHGRTTVAYLLVRKNKKLMSIPNKKGFIPVVLACACSDKELTLFLYSETPLDVLISDNYGSLLLHFCILNKMLDIAWNLLEKKPRLAVTNNHQGFSPVFTLSSQTYWVIREADLPFWRRWIYYGVELAYTSTKVDLYKIAREILQCMRIELSTLNASEIIESGVIPALFQAIQHGLYEFIDEIAMSNLDLVVGQLDYSLFFHAIEYRQDTYLSNVGISIVKSQLLAFRDKDNNSILHLAAKLAPESCLGRLPGAALQMQRELQWFKEIESMAPEFKVIMNKESETPQVVFSREHKELLKKGEEWMKQTAQSYSVVGAFIITIMFAAAFTLPGGNKQETGFPMFLHKKSFMVFMLSDAISLFSASTSVMMFLGILTSRYAEEDFLRSLPTKLLIGLCSLFISIATMMVSFSTAVAIMLHGEWWIVSLLVLFAGIPVFVFLWLQSRQVVDIFNSTYRWRLFERRRSSRTGLLSSMWRKLKTLRNCN